MISLMQSQERRKRLMGKMIERLDVDLEAAGHQARGTVLRQAVRACQFCANTEACERWFDGGAQDDSYRTFCPNADRFANMAKVTRRRTTAG